MEPLIDLYDLLDEEAVISDDESYNGDAPGIIYMLTSPVGKSYIGQTTKAFDGRMRDHARAAIAHGRCVALYAAVRKYGWKNFKQEVLLQCPARMLDYYETQGILLYGTLAPDGYNLETGGHAGKKASEETKQRMSYSAKHNRDNSVYSKADTSVHRRSEEAKTLPKYLQRVDDKRRQGYKIKDHPNCKFKIFAGTKMSDAEKLAHAKEFLDRLNSGYVAPRRQVRTLPKGLYLNKHGYNIFYLRADGTEFRKAFGPSPDARDKAMAVLEALRFEDTQIP